jgi:hypothetical protein
MIYIVLNAVPILLAAIAATGLHVLWFHPHPKARSVGAALLSQIWLGAILAGALILAPPKGGLWVMTLGSAFIIWVGFILPALAASYRLRALPWQILAIDAGYWLASMLLQATTMRLIGLVPPPA